MQHAVKVFFLSTRLDVGRSVPVVVVVVVVVLVVVDVETIADASFVIMGFRAVYGLILSRKLPLGLESRLCGA